MPASRNITEHTLRTASRKICGFRIIPSRLLATTLSRIMYDWSRIESGCRNKSIVRGSRAHPRLGKYLSRFGRIRHDVGHRRCLWAPETSTLTYSQAPRYRLLAPHVSSFSLRFARTSLPKIATGAKGEAAAYTGIARNPVGVWATRFRSVAAERRGGTRIGQENV